MDCVKTADGKWEFGREGRMYYAHCQLPNCKALGQDKVNAESLADLAHRMTLHEALLHNTAK